jgi:hypothetical protein
MPYGCGAFDLKIQEGKVVKLFVMKPKEFAITGVPLNSFWISSYP